MTRRAFRSLIERRLGPDPPPADATWRGARRHHPNVPPRLSRCCGYLARSDLAAALVVEGLDGVDHQLDAEAVVNEVVARAPEDVGELMVAQQADDGRGEGL